MGYALRNDGQGWRTVNSSKDCANDETYQEVQPAPIIADAWIAIQSQAQIALDKSDITMIRCIENGAAVPAGWVSYRKALRAIICATTGDAAKQLPTRPSFPVGT